MSKLRIAEGLSITAVVVGAAVISIVASLTDFSTAAAISLMSAVLGLLGLYLLTSNILVERRLRLLEERGPTPAASEMLTQIEWYEQLDMCLRAAKTAIDITHHEPRLPSLSGIPAKAQVFTTLGKRIRQRRVLVRWIIAINTPQKLDWVKELLEKYGDCQNLDIRHAPVAQDAPRPPLSVQITDRDKAFVIDMGKSHHSLSELDTDLYTRDPAVVRQLRRYYDTYWDRCEKIKEGGMVHQDTLHRLAKELSADAAA